MLTLKQDRMIWVRITAVQMYINQYVFLNMHFPLGRINFAAQTNDKAVLTVS